MNICNGVYQELVLTYTFQLVKFPFHNGNVNEKGKCIE